MRLTLVIPAHNEARRIGPTLRAYRGAFGPDVELLVVANECADDTVAVTRAAIAELGGIELLELSRPGKGGAVRAGLAQARGDCVGFVDADLAFPPEMVLRVLAAAERSGAAVGSRRRAESRGSGPRAGRDVAGRVFAALARALFGLRFRDTQCGLKIFQRRFLDGYLAQARVDDFAFDVELLLLLDDAGATIEEVPLTWIAQPGSPTLGTGIGFARHGARMLRSLLLMRRRRRGLERRGARSREGGGVLAPAADPAREQEAGAGQP